MRNELIVGQDDQLDTLRAMINGLMHGPAVGLITGQPGAGKSTLWQHVCDHARGRGYRVLSLRPGDIENDLPFMGLICIFDDGDLTVDDLPAPQRQALAAALMRATPDGGELPSPSAVAVAFVTVVRRLAAATPLLIAVDDVARLDTASATVFGHLVRRLRTEQVGLLLTTVGETGAGWPTVLGVDDAFDRVRHHHVHVGPLNTAQLRHLVELRTGLALARPNLLRLTEVSGGNPRTALQIANALLSGANPLMGRLLPVGAQWVSTVEAMMGALPELSRVALLMAAAVDHPTTQQVRAALNTPGPLTPGLTEAERAGLLQVNDGEVRFTHPTYAAAVYAAAGGELRRCVHMRLSAVLADPLEAARHLALATDNEDADVAATVEQAAREAQERGVPGAAAELWTLASHRTPLTDPRRGHRLVAAALCLFWAGDCAQSRTMLVQALATAISDQERAHVLLWLASVTFYDSGAMPAVRMLRRARTMAADPQLIAELNLRTAWFAEHDLGLRMASVRAARRWLQQVDSVRDGLPATVAITSGYLDFLAGRGSDPMTLRDAAATLPGAGLSWEAELAQTMAAVVEGHTDVRHTRTAWLEKVNRARQLGYEAAVPLALYHLTLAECWLGEWELAGPHAEEMIEAVEQTGQRKLRSSALYLRALLAAHRGDVAVATAAIDRGLTLAEQVDDSLAMMSHLAVRGFLQLSAGDFAAADGCLTQASTLADKTGVREPVWLRFMSDQVEAAVAVGAVPRAEQLLADLGNRTGRPGDPWLRVIRARGQAQVLMARGELPDAVAAIDKAYPAHSSLQAPFELARTCLVHGQVLRRLRRRRAADHALRQAEALFTDLGAALWVPQAAAERLRLGYHRSGSGQLTPTEAQVAKLVAEQYSNSEIAAALLISRRTVENHLARIYRKLQLSGRAQLGATIAADGTHVG